MIDHILDIGISRNLGTPVTPHVLKARVVCIWPSDNATRITSSIILPAWSARYLIQIVLSRRDFPCGWSSFKPSPCFESMRGTCSFLLPSAHGIVCLFGISKQFPNRPQNLTQFQSSSQRVSSQDAFLQLVSHDFCTHLRQDSAKQPCMAYGHHTLGVMLRVGFHVGRSPPRFSWE